jgi:16S rRNA (adenine(1408)-N(1))-methyltransferase
VIDLGTGDGRAVLAEAAADPTALVIGVDAVAAAMVESSRRAMRRSDRHSDRAAGSNVLFVVSGVELLPVSLAGFADRVIVRFPWGSLLQGALGRAPVAGAIAGLVKPGGELELVLSLTERDRPRVQSGDLGGVEIGQVVEAFSARGLRLTEARALTSADLGPLASTWARRLRVGIDRPASLLRFRRGEAGG